jgi:hypothetical protein
MPFIITSPETKNVTQKYLIDNQITEVTKSRTIDHVNIEHIEVRMPINNATGIGMSVIWSLGYMDGSTFFPTERGTAELAGEALIAKMMEAVYATNGNTHYTDFKGALYSLLVQLNFIPAGAIV